MSSKRSTVLALAVWLAVGSAAAAAQENPGAPNAEDEKPLASVRVRHDHALGSGDGELRVTASGFEFRGDGEEAAHSVSWRDGEIKRLEIDADEIEIYVYEAARIPLLPEKLPYVDATRSVRVGAERRYAFRVVDGAFAPALVGAILERFDRPVATTVLPEGVEDAGRLLFEVPVFHRHLTGGEPGVLRAYERFVIFAAEREDRSRLWRYADIRDIARVGRWQFELATYEAKAFTDGKSYLFDLKRPITETEYEALWRVLYER